MFLMAKFRTGNKRMRMKSPRRRFRLFTDWNIQGKILVRLAFAWIACQTIMVVTILGFLALEGTDPAAANSGTSAWRFIGPAIVASTAVFPVVLLDMLIFTNRFTGPLRRFRNHLQCLAEGQMVSTLHFRPGDQLSDMSYHVNEVRSALVEANRQESEYEETSYRQSPQHAGGKC
jgi:hypothetical protein